MTAVPPPARVVIVDDDDAVRSSLLRLLGALGYAVRGYSSGGAFLADAEQSDTPLDCVVIDILMPDMHGDTVVERLRQVRGEVPVIFITGSDDQATQERVAAAGGRAAFAKPVDPRALLSEIRAVLSRPGVR
jgi:FixJ family two-component response regulator